MPRIQWVQHPNMSGDGHDCKISNGSQVYALINHTPNDPNTMLTTMNTATTMTKQIGQTTLPYTWDQQLYKICIDIIFNNMDRFVDLIPILGGLYF